MPKVSVIIPVYNVEKYLRQCLDSVINQTLQDIEIICVDDGSTDNCPNILDEYAAKDARIKIIHKKNEGYGKAMNVGISHASGEYIGIVEPDDYIELNMYETLYEIAKNKNIEIIKGDYWRFKTNGDNEEKELLLMDYNKKYYDTIINPQENIDVFYFQMHTWTGIYKNTFIKKYNIKHNETPGASYQDTGFWFLTLCYCTRFYIVNLPFYMYRVDNPNASIKNKTKVYALKHEYDYIYNILKNNKQLYKKFIAIFWYRKFCSYLWNFYRIEYQFKKKFLEILKKEFNTAYNAGEINELLFPEQKLIILQNILKNPDKFYKITTNSPSLLQKIFSIRNQNSHKIIRILGIKFKIKRKFSEDRERLKRIEQKIDTLYNLYSKSEANYIRKNLHH